MAIVIIKSPCVGPGCVYYAATQPGETISIPDSHVAELDPKCLIVIEAHSPSLATPIPRPGSLLREQDWVRQTTPEEAGEILALRRPDPAPAVRRRA